MRPVVVLAVFASIFPAAASASGSYLCCLVDKQGTRYVYSGRASTHFKGSIADLCRHAAKERKARRCNATETVDLSFDFVKGRDGFGPDEHREHVNLSTRCELEGCAIGLTLGRETQTKVQPEGDARCELAVFPAPKGPPETAAYTLRMSSKPGKANACLLIVGDKRTLFYNDGSAPD